MHHYENIIPNNFFISSQILNLSEEQCQYFFSSARNWNSGCRGLKFQFSWSFFELNVLLIFVISFGIYTYCHYVEYPFHVPEKDTCCFGNENVRKQLNRILGDNASWRLDKDSFIILFQEKWRKNDTVLISRFFSAEQTYCRKDHCNSHISDLKFYSNLYVYSIIYYLYVYSFRSKVLFQFVCIKYYYII